MQRRARNNPVIFYLVLGCVSLGLAAAAMEAASHEYFLIREQKGTDLRVFAPALPGSGMPISAKKNFSQIWSTTEFTIHVRTNSLGIREDLELPPTKVDVGFLGDSFTFGQGVEAGERYSDRLRERLGDRVVASYAYANGWAPPHYYLFLREHPELIPRVAVLGLCLANDLTTDMADSELTVSETGELVRIRLRSRETDALGRLVSTDQNTVNRLLRHFWSGQLLLHLDKNLGLNLPLLRQQVRYGFAGKNDLEHGELSELNRLALEYVAKTDRLVRENGGELVVVLIPLAEYVGPYRHLFSPQLTPDILTHLYLSKALQEWCRQHAIACIDPIPDFRVEEQRGRRMYFAADPHWTEAGHRKAAEILWRELGERGLLEQTHLKLTEAVDAN